MSVFAVILIFVAAVAMVVIAFMFMERFGKAGVGIALPMLGPAMVLFIFLVFDFGPQAFGYTHVPDRAEALSDRLESGTLYSVIAEERMGAVGGDKLLLLGSVGGSAPNTGLRVVRIKGDIKIPRNFRLIGGEVVPVN